MLATAKITSKGQVTLPKRVRSALSLDTGSVVGFVQVEGRVYLRPLKTLREYRGVLRGAPERDSDTLRQRAKAARSARVFGRR